LKSISASNFEAVQTGTIYTSANVPTGRSPTISRFTANPTNVASGQPVTLSWTTSAHIYNLISPQIGPGRRTRMPVIPTATTTYTLYSTNQSGRTTASVTVTVH